MSLQAGQVNNLSDDLVYSPRLGNDETVGPDGQTKDHWTYLLRSLQSLGKQAFTDRQHKASRILRDDGATYNIHLSGGVPSQAWELDLVPALISSDEWAAVEAGLLERSELFDLLFKDIYGSRDLLRTHVLPPEALFCHPGFLRACHGINLPGEHQLVLHAVDLMTCADGSMCVLTDRTQSPAGAGYALENRTVMSRVFPSLFRDSHVHRLAVFFQRLRSKLTALALHQDQPRVVVLTPGAHDGSYFEHAYIANYLGLHLVQSGDLIVRNGYLWMKSLDGLSRVDVVLRRVDDWYCDPVELRGDSVYGVANLLEVVRAGRVAIANPLGAGVLESPIFLKFLPDIAKALLGRELRLQSVQTYWCGDPQDRQFVIDNLDSLIIKPTFRMHGFPARLGRLLSVQERADLLARIEKSPVEYSAQPEINASHLPTFSDGALVPRPAILRTFALASDGSYTLMPGGLTRVGMGADSFMQASQSGAQSKDTWVLASEPERGEEAAVEEVAVREAELISLPSRVVENLFWMGRYAERSEASLRILRTVFIMLNGEERISETCKRVLLRAVTAVTATRPGFFADKEALFAAPDEELLLVVKDPERMGSVRSNLNAMLQCADESKELLSSDTLRVINDIRDALSDLDHSLSGGLASAPEEALDPLVTALMAQAGLSQESMIRGVGWRFMEIGRRLERGLQTITIIKSLLVDEVAEHPQHTLVQALLMTLEVLISYRRRYRARINVQSGLDLVLLDTQNPRSLLYQLEQLGRHIDALPKPADKGNELSPEARALLEAETLVKLSRLQELSQLDDGKRSALEARLDQIAGLLGATSTAISEKYFEHRESSRQLVRNVWETDE